MENSGHDFESVLLNGLRELAIEVDCKVVENFIKYKDELNLWNRKIDLTGLNTDEEFAIKHFIDSLIPARFIKENAFLMDIGTGGGFPGIPLKIYRPDLKVLLLESSEKKVVFLKHIIRVLGLKDITPINQRAEDKGFQSIMKETVDVVISRAFTKFKDFFDIARFYVKQGGSIIGMLGREWESRLKEAEPSIRLYGFEVRRKECFNLPGNMGTRAIAVIVRK